jgi:hypothetical protein
MRDAVIIPYRETLYLSKLSPTVSWFENAIDIADIAIPLICPHASANNPRINPEPGRYT